MQTSGVSSLDSPHPVAPQQRYSRRHRSQRYGHEQADDEGRAAAIPVIEDVTKSGPVRVYVITELIRRKYPIARKRRHQEISERPLRRKQHREERDAKSYR